MNSIINILESMLSQNDNDIDLDRNFLQGVEAVRKQLIIRTGQTENVGVEFFINTSNQVINDLIHKVQPSQIPDDYLFFLKYCGGVRIDKNEYNFTTFGIGPMVEEYYCSINSDSAYPGLVEKYSYLPIGEISFRQGVLKYQYVSFFLDIVGHVQHNGIIKVGPWRPGIDDPDLFFENLFEHKNLWEVTSDSFTGWLSEVEKTKGTFSYFT